MWTKSSNTSNKTCHDNIIQNRRAHVDDGAHLDVNIILYQTRMIGVWTAFIEKRLRRGTQFGLPTLPDRHRSTITASYIYILYSLYTLQKRSSIHINNWILFAHCVFWRYVIKTRTTRGDINQKTVVWRFQFIMCRLCFYTHTHTHTYIGKYIRI